MKTSYSNSDIVNTAYSIPRSLFLFPARRNAHASLDRLDMTVSGWAQHVFADDPETLAHSQRVSMLAGQMASLMGLNKADVMYTRWGALLHDIGKQQIPAAIQDKPGAFTPNERAVMELHTIYGYDALLSEPFLRHLPGWQRILDIPLYHHEHWDGRGYPYGLRGETIPLSARICAVADVWDALRSKRAYREAWEDHRAERFLREQSGTQFDPRVIQVFLRLIEHNRTSTLLSSEQANAHESQSTVYPR
jgi:putative nucleotidyltransferase with HDIG domain